MTHDAPHDRFDEALPHESRVGAHRAPRRSSSGWRRAGLILLSGVLLAGVGIGALMVYNSRLNFADLGVSASPTPEPAVKLDTAVPVTVLNGTTIDGLGDQVATKLQASQLQVTVASAENTATANSVVFYSSDSLEAAARGVAGLLGNVPIKLDPSLEARGMPIVVLIGGDYPATSATTPAS